MLALGRCSLIAPFLVSPTLRLPSVAPELRIKRQNSSDSLSSLNSITSHSSISSSKDADAKKKKKKSWVGWAGGRLAGGGGVGSAWAQHYEPTALSPSWLCGVGPLCPLGQHW